jgi:hypothetical protein
MKWYKVRRATPMGVGYVWSTIGHVLLDLSKEGEPMAFTRDLFSNGFEEERRFIYYGSSQPQPNSAYAQQA